MGMTRECIEDFRKIVIPFVRKRLLEIDYENLGKSDAEEFTRDFNEILNLAIKALEQEPTTKNYLSEEDILELKHRYGDEVEFVVRDMISGEGKRWE